MRHWPGAAALIVRSEKMKRLVAMGLALLAVYGCSGQWTDDPGNWKRAFGSSAPPKDVTIVHSFYRRTSAVPREQDWAFELKISAAQRKLMFENLNLRHPGERETSAVELLTKKEAQPSWFLPKPSTNYDAWISAEKAGVYVGAFEDKESGNIFLVGVEL